MSVKSADRALRVVEYLAEHGAAGFSEILNALDLPRSSGHGLIQTLVASGWVSHDPSARLYSLGLRVWQIGESYAGHRTLVEAAGPIMARLVADVGETVQIARLEGTENVYIAVRESRHPVRIASAVGSRMDAHATGVGKALFSMLPPEELKARLTAAAPLRALTKNTVTSVEDVLARAARVRELGYALDDEEALSGIRCVAVPLTDLRQGGMLSAISITTPVSRTGEGWPEPLVEPLLASAALIRQALGRRASG